MGRKLGGMRLNDHREDFPCFADVVRRSIGGVNEEGSGGIALAVSFLSPFRALIGGFLRVREPGKRSVSWVMHT